MGKFRCRICNYCFEIAQEAIPRVCPNCGELRGMSKEKSADELIQDNDLD